MSGDKRYAYGIVEDESLELTVDGVRGATDVYTVGHRRHAAVVSDVDVLEPEETDENTRAHDAVIKAVMEHDGGRAIVPMRFGMVFANERTLKNVLQSSRAAITKAMRNVDGREELGVKVLVPEEGIDGADAVRQAIVDDLAAYSVAQSEGDLFTDRLLVNRSYLVNREDEGAFDRAVEDVRDEHESLTVQYSGPWPPYSFVDLRIRAAQ